MSVGYALEVAPRRSRGRAAHRSLARAHGGRARRRVCARAPLPRAPRRRTTRRLHRISDALSDIDGESTMRIALGFVLFGGAAWVVDRSINTVLDSLKKGSRALRRGIGIGLFALTVVLAVTLRDHLPLPRVAPERDDRRWWYRPADLQYALLRRSQYGVHLAGRRRCSRVSCTICAVAPPRDDGTRCARYARVAAEHRLRPLRLPRVRRADARGLFAPRGRLRARAPQSPARRRHHGRQPARRAARDGGGEPALGATQVQTIVRVSLPYAWPRISARSSSALAVCSPRALRSS